MRLVIGDRSRRTSTFWESDRRWVEEVRLDVNSLNSVPRVSLFNSFFSAFAGTFGGSGTSNTQPQRPSLRTFTGM